MSTSQLRGTHASQKQTRARARAAFAARSSSDIPALRRVCKGVTVQVCSEETAFGEKDAVGWCSDSSHRAAQATARALAPVLDTSIDIERT